MSLIEAVHFTNMTERFSANVRDVHSVKTVHVCPRKQLQESVYHAVCVDTCFDAQMMPDSQPEGGPVEQDFILSFSFWHGGINMQRSRCTVSERI